MDIKCTFVVAATRPEMRLSDLPADQRAVEALLKARGWTTAHVRGLGKVRGSTLRDRFSEIGRKGGKSRSPAKLKALAKARKVLAAKRKAVTK